MQNFITRHRWLLILLLAGIILHLLLILPGLTSNNPEGFFSRPDSAGYLGPGRALAVNHAYLNEIDGAPHFVRVPGLPAFLAVIFTVFGVYNTAAAVLFLGFVGVATAIPVYLAGREWRDQNTGILAAALFLLYPTALANRPLLLTDTLFTFFVALQFYYFVRLCKRRDWTDFAAAAGAAAFGALIRPINFVWILPALVMLGAVPGIPWKKKLAGGAAGLLVFAAVLYPWMARNAALGAGWTLDTNTGAMVHQNGAMLLAAVNGTEYEAEKQRIIAEVNAELADPVRYPDEKSREAYRVGRYQEMIKAHPTLWLRQQFQLKTLLPDFPSLCENLGLTKSDRGTLNVLRQKGLWAAVNHYFDGKLYILPVLGVLMIFPALLALGCATGFFLAAKNFKRDYMVFLLFLGFAEYYFFLPGAITVPRYQIPALPFCCALAAAGLLFWHGKWRAGKNT